MTPFTDLRDVAPKKIWDGVVARIIEGDQATLAIVELAPGSEVREHRHGNEQNGFVIEGSVTFTVGAQTREMGPGGTWQIMGNVPHRCVAGPQGAVVCEVYAPVRADWQQVPPGEPAATRWP